MLSIEDQVAAKFKKLPDDPVYQFIVSQMHITQIVLGAHITEKLIYKPNEARKIIVVLIEDKETGKIMQETFNYTKLLRSTIKVVRK